MKLAAIDIGSNSIHMIVVGASSNHSFEVIDREKEMVFLGRSVFEHGRLTEQAMTAGLETLGKFHKLATSHGVTEIRAVATAAVREAENGGDFLYAVSEKLGVMPQVISGSEEARYIYLSVRHAVDLSRESALVIDIGGGSVETIVGDAVSMRLGRSIKLGVQRLRAAFGGGAPLGKKERKELEEHVTALASETLAAARQARFDFVIGTSGTALALGQAARALSGAPAWTAPTGQVIRLEQLQALCDRLVSSTPEERAALEGIDEARADSIHVGAVLLVTLLELAKVDRITLCDSALREGLVLDYLESRADEIRRFEVVKDIRRLSVAELARRCGQSGPHPVHVARLALSLFDQTRALHRLDDDDRMLLEHAAILHDVGQHIGYERHEHHAAYIIMNGELRGFTEEERTILALLARYHRKARPRREDAEFAALPPERRELVRVLAGILRICDGLDRSHHQLVTGLSSEARDGTLHIRLASVGDAELELWGARRKARLLERALGVGISLELDQPARETA